MKPLYKKNVFSKSDLSDDWRGKLKVYWLKNLVAASNYNNKVDNECKLKA